VHTHDYIFVLFILILATSAFGSVTVSSPANGSKLGSPVHYVATGTAPSCDRGVASMGIYVDDVLKYVQNGDKLDTEISFDAGSYNTTVEEWDYCGGASYTHVDITVSGSTGVWVTSPTDNDSVTSPVHYQATATTDKCDKGVASMGIYVNNVLKYTTQGASLDTDLSLSPGKYDTVVEEWDHCGGAAYTHVAITVVEGSDNQSTFSKLQASSGWVGYGELPPDYKICRAPCPGVTWSMKQHIGSPSRSGNSTKFNLGGTKPYSDALWTLGLIGQNTTQGMPDKNHTIIPTLHNFTYDAYFYTTQLSLSQVLEFDINMYFNGLSFVWGNQCRIAGGHAWDIWDNVDKKWVPAGAPCNPINNGWNHVVIQVQRTSDNRLLFQSISLNGNKHVINKYYAHGKCPNNWYGFSVNYQMDGNSKQTDYSTYLDDFNVTYW